MPASYGDVLPCRLLEGMKDQFRKHIREAIANRHIREGVDEAGDTIAVWADGKVPRLHYELRGDFFNTTHQSVKTSLDDIRDEFIDIIANDPGSEFEKLRELLEYGTDSFDSKLDDFLRIEVYDELVPPFSS